MDYCPPAGPPPQPYYVKGRLSYDKYALWQHRDHIKEDYDKVAAKNGEQLAKRYAIQKEMEQQWLKGRQRIAQKT